MLWNRWNGMFFCGDKGGAGGGGGKTPAGDGNSGASAGAASGAPTGGDGGDGGGGLDWEGWLEAQPEEVRKLYEEHTSGLKTALKSERQQRKDLASQLQATAKKLEEGSEERKALEAQAERLEEVEARASFYEDAVRPEIGCSNPRLAYLAAKEIEAFDRRGAVNWDALKKSFPELFKKARVPGNAGSGGDQPPASGGGMNDFIRTAAGRQ